MDFQLMSIAVTLSFFHLLSASPSAHFVQKSLTLDLTTTDDGDTIGEWIVSTQSDRILFLEFQSEQPIDKAVVESLLTISDSRDDTSVLFPIPDSESILPIYSTGNSVLIRLNNKKLLKDIPKFQLKIEKAVSCPESLGGSSACDRIVDDVSCYCATFSNWTWRDTNLYCHIYGMNFAALESSEEDQAIFSTWGRQQSYWIGASDIGYETTFVWDATGVPLSPGYTNWNPGEPNNAHNNENCVFIHTTGKWFDGDCSWNTWQNSDLGGICELQP